jgi:hypothetical protein
MLMTLWNCGAKGEEVELEIKYLEKLELKTF